MSGERGVASLLGAVGATETAAGDVMPRGAAPQMLRKHVAAVHTSGELSLVERKISNILLLNAYDNLISPEGAEVRHTIPVDYLGQMMGWDESKNVTSLKRALKSLQQTIIEFNLMRDGKEDWESMPLLSYGRIHNGVCTYGYVGELAKKLHDPDVFALINVGMQKRFKGGYSLTLYENCVRYRNVQSTGWWPLDKFRRLLGAEASTYDDFKRFSAFVVKKAVEEVSRVSDIRLVPEYQRENRRVVAIRFAVFENPQATLFGANQLDDEELAVIRASEAFKKLIYHGISERLALMWLKQDRVRATQAIEAAEIRYSQGKIKSTGGYIRRLFEDGAVLGKSQFEKDMESQGGAQSAKAQKSEAREMRKRAAEDRKILEDLRVEFDIHRKQRYMEALTPSQWQALALEFYEQLTPDMQEKAGRFDPRKAKFTNAGVSVNFRNVWLVNRMGQPTAEEFELFVKDKGHDLQRLRESAALA